MDAKTLQGDLQSLGFTPSLKWKRRLGDEEPNHKMTERNESGWLVGEVKKSRRGEVG